MFFGLRFADGICSFLTPIFFYVTDGWMGDGWVMDGWVMGDGGDGGSKKCSRISLIFFRWSSGDINVRKFGKSAKNFFIVKKSNFNFHCDGWGIDGSQKCSRILLNFFWRSSGDINVGEFGKSAKNFFYQKKILLQLPKSGGFLVEKKVLWFFSKFCQMVI